jgi:SAM-dependent methyltransferase
MTTNAKVDMSEYQGCDNLEAMEFARNYNQFLIRQIISFRSGDGEMLDFGAGIGTFAVPLHSRGLPVICIEPDERMRTGLRESGLIAYPDLASIPRSSVDYIFSLNVLEHIENDRSVLKELYDALRKGGKLFLYVPAFQFLFSSMDSRVGHFRRYSKSGIIAKLQESGFVVEFATYVDSIGFFASIFFKYFGRNDGHLSPRAVKTYDKYLFPLSVYLDRIAGQAIGKNLQVVCIKR